MPDPVGRHMVENIRHLGVRGVKKVTTAQLYRLVGELTAMERQRVAEELLCDPVIQLATDGSLPTAREDHLDVVTIDVWYKAGVTDVAGESVLKGLRDMDIQGVNEVRTGMRYRLWGFRDSKTADRLALALIVNPLVQDREVRSSK